MQEAIKKLTQSANGYHYVLTDLYIQDVFSGVHKIDAVIIHETGIYVLKLEEHRGDIYGKEHEEKWFSTLYKGRNDTYFFNPVQINRESIRLLQQKTEIIPTFHFHSWIVFTDQCELKEIEHHSPHIRIMQEKDIVETLHKQLYSVEPLYTPIQIDTIYQFLLPYTQVSSKVRKVYEKHHQKQQDKQEAPSIYRPKKSSKGWIWLIAGVLVASAVGTALWLL